MTKKNIWLALIGIHLLLLVGCGNEEANNQVGQVVAISGSTSVGPLTEKLAQAYKLQSEDKIEVNQIGSSAGIMNAINGVSEIGMSSRDLKEDEASKLQATIIAFDGIVVVTHPSNKVNKLTLKQVKQIFTGEIANWKQLGGEDKEIVVVSREDGSGSRDAFQEIVGYTSSELIKNAIIASGNGNIKTTVAMNPHAVGFISFEYIDSSISTIAINGVEATATNVLSGDYKLARPFLFVYKESNLSEATQHFIEFIISDEGQQIVEAAGAIRVN